MNNIGGTANSFHLVEREPGAIERKTASQPEDGSMSGSEADRVEGIDLRKRKVAALEAEQETKAGTDASLGKKARKVDSPAEERADTAQDPPAVSSQRLLGGPTSSSSSSCSSPAGGAGMGQETRAWLATLLDDPLVVTSDSKAGEATMPLRRLLDAPDDPQLQAIWQGLFESLRTRNAHDRIDALVALLLRALDQGEAEAPRAGLVRGFRGLAQACGGADTAPEEASRLAHQVLGSGAARRAQAFQALCEGFSATGWRARLHRALAGSTRSFGEAATPGLRAHLRAGFTRMLRDLVPTDARLGDAAIAQRLSKELDAFRGFHGGPDPLAMLLGALLDHLAPVAGRHTVQVRALLAQVARADTVEALLAALAERSDALALAKEALEALVAACALQLVKEQPAADGAEGLAGRVHDLLRQACRVTPRMDSGRVIYMGRGLANGLGGSVMGAQLARAALQGTMTGLSDMEPAKADDLMAGFVAGMGGRTMPDPLLREVVDAVRDVAGDAVPGSRIEAARKGACRGVGKRAPANAAGGEDIGSLLNKVGSLPSLEWPRPEWPELAPSDVDIGKLACHLNTEFRQHASLEPGLALRLELVALALAPALAADPRVPDDVEARQGVLTAFLAREASDAGASNADLVPRAYVFACRLGLPALPDAEQRRLVGELIARARAHSQPEASLPRIYWTLWGVLQALALPPRTSQADVERINGLLAWTLPLCFARAPQVGAASSLKTAIARSISAVTFAWGRLLRQPEQVVQAALAVLVAPAPQLAPDDGRRWMPLRETAGPVLRWLPSREAVCDEALRFALRAAPENTAHGTQRTDLANAIKDVLKPSEQDFPERLAHALSTVAGQDHASAQEIGRVVIALCPGSPDRRAAALLTSIRAFPVPRQVTLLKAFPTRRAIESWRSVDDALCRFLAAPPPSGAEAFPGDALSKNERRQLSLAYALAAGVRESAEAKGQVRGRFAPSPQAVTEYQRLCLRGVEIARDPFRLFRVNALIPGDDAMAADDPRLALFNGIYAVPGLLTAKSLPEVISDTVSNVEEPLLRMECLATLFRLGTAHAKPGNFRLARQQMTSDLRRIYGEHPLALRGESKGEEPRHESAAASEKVSQAQALRYTQALGCLGGLYTTFRQHDSGSLAFVFQAPAADASAADREAYAGRVSQKKKQVEKTLRFIEEEIAEVDRPALPDRDAKGDRKVERVDQPSLPAHAHDQLRTVLEGVRTRLAAALALVPQAAPADEMSLDD